jgi:hypothetical protein
MMRKIIFVAMFFMAFCTSCLAHTEILAQLTFVNYNNELYVKAVLDKDVLVLALKEEGDCTPQMMLKECGDKFFKTYIKSMVNGEAVELEKIAFDIEQKQVVFNYKIKVKSKIKSISLESDYMLKYNSHGGIKVFFGIEEHKSSYTMTANRRKITANFK